ncbi:MAG: peptidoglycan-binding protein, partial [Merismopedia sp. SIO2A8]|nr:peptidoglycan-binding protein [Merismopedia sp. SIO2A8]
GTNRAIRKLQAQYGLVADGIIGPATWGKLLG